MSQTPRVRSPLLYRAVVAVAAMGIGYVLLSGRITEYAGSMRQGGSTPTDFSRQFVTAIIWLVSIAPLTLAAWELGAQHTAARRFGTAIWQGLLELFKIAWRGSVRSDMMEEFSEAPGDDPALALLVGLAVAVSLPVFFLSVATSLRTVRGGLWLGVAGLLMGTVAYCHRRAGAYITDEPAAFDLFRQHRLLNPARYAAPGRPFVRLQLAAIIVLAVWWLVGGALLVM